MRSSQACLMPGCVEEESGNAKDEVSYQVKTEQWTKCRRVILLQLNKTLASFLILCCLANVAVSFVLQIP